MNSNKRLLLLVFSVVAIQTNNGELDPSILSELTPEQIETAMDLYNLKPADVPIDDLPMIEESLVKNDTSIDAEISEEENTTDLGKYGEFSNQCLPH